MGAKRFVETDDFLSEAAEGEGVVVLLGAEDETSPEEALVDESGDGDPRNTSSFLGDKGSLGSRFLNSSFRLIDIIACAERVPAVEARRVQSKDSDLIVEGGGA